MTTTENTFIKLTAEPSARPPRFLIIGAGSRGRTYAEAIHSATSGIVAAVAEPIAYKRNFLGKARIWKDEAQPSEGQSFEGWREFVAYEVERRERVRREERGVPEGVDGVFVCVLDEMHSEVVVGLGPLEVHVMCEKPMACSLRDCLEMYKALRPSQSSRVFSIGHVLRYSPHHMMLRRLLVEEKVIGEINSVVHTEPVGWRHFTHSYVRGNWRNDKTTGPTLLTKSCHDIDLLMWLLSYPEKAGKGQAHHPSTISSTGGLQFFKKSRKPAAAGSATNCTKCPLGDSGCKYSAKHVYLGDHDKGLGAGNLHWPIVILVPDIEDYATQEAKVEAVMRTLEDDYDDSTPAEEVSKRNWFGRCVFEADNNVCDDEFVTITWPESTRPAKRATFHMVAQTTKVCERYSNFYGEHGEIYADSSKITIQDFASGTERTYHPKIEDLGHGGGDLGLTRQFVTAVDRVKNGGMSAGEAQCEYLGCTLDEVVRSHAMVFAAEEARLGQKVVDWEVWWEEAVASVLRD